MNDVYMYSITYVKQIMGNSIKFRMTPIFIVAIPTPILESVVVNNRLLCKKKYVIIDHIYNVQKDKKTFLFSLLYFILFHTKYL